MNHHQPSGDPSTTEPTSSNLWHVGTLTYTRAGLAVLFSLLLWGDFAWSMKERSAAPVLQIIVKDFHASDTEMQWFMVVIPNAMGILLGPVIGYRSDRHRGRWGRRIPYLMVSTPFAALALIGVGFSPSMGHALHIALGRHSPGLDISIRIFLGIFWVIFEVATVTANAVFGGLINDVVPRGLLGRFYGLFRAFSLIAGMAINFKLLGLAEVHYKAIFLGIGLLYGLGFMLMCLTVREGEYPPPAPEELSGGVSNGFLTAAVAYLKESFSHPYYLWVMLALTFGTLTFMPVNNFSQPFAKSLHVSNDVYGKYLFTTYAISLLLAVFVGYLADWFHPLRTGIVVMVIYAAAMLWGDFCSSDAKVLFYIPHTSGGVSQPIPVQMFAIALIAHGVISGTFFTCTASLAQRLFPKARFAQFASAAAVMIAVTSMIFAAWTGLYFDTHGPVYQRTYGMGFGLAVAGVITMLIVHRQFMALGGTRAYVAP
jgi:MFS family permease